MYSTLQQRLAAGQKVITGEIAPPKGAERDALVKLALGLRDSVDAVNLTENQRGMVRMSALGAGVISQQVGLEPIVQITCQHRNRIALQADLLSAVALGIHNFTCMTGDHPQNGDHPEAKSVLDLNSFQLLRMLRQMRDEGKTHSGGILKDKPSFFLGAVANPNIEKAKRAGKKIEAGAEFIQTQIIFDLPRFRDWMGEARALGIHQEAHILAGVMILRNVQGAILLRDALPGSLVPASVVERMTAATDPEAEGITLAAELVQELLSIEGVAGVHLMSVGWTRAMPRVVEKSGLLPRPPVPQTK